MKGGAIVVGLLLVLVIYLAMTGKLVTVWDTLFKGAPAGGGVG